MNALLQAGYHRRGAGSAHAKSTPSAPGEAVAMTCSTRIPCAPSSASTRGPGLFFFFFSFGLWLPRTRFYLFSFFHRLILPPPNCAFLWARLGPHSASKARPGKGAASGCRGDGSQSARSARRNSAICSARWPRGLRPYMFSPRAPLPRISAALRHPEESGQRMTGVNTRVKTQVLAQLRAGVGEPRRSLPARSK